ncbi:MAG: nicotinate-nucleotide diphosphorylase [Bacteroidia bacterium]
MEVETRNLNEVREALDCEGVQRVMLDNFSPALIREALSLIQGRVETEASGGIHLGNLKEYAETQVDFISLGALTHSVKALDISFKTSIL